MHRQDVIDDMLGSAMTATGDTFRVELNDVVSHGPCLAAATDAVFST